MQIESIKPLVLELSEKTVQLNPGEPMELADEVAERLVKKAPHALRMVEKSASSLLNEGLLTWESPRFGATPVRALEITADWVLVQAIRTERLLAWVRKEQVFATEKRGV
jgi:hypothetical protein